MRDTHMLGYERNVRGLDDLFQQRAQRCYQIVRPKAILAEGCSPGGRFLKEHRLRLAGLHRRDVVCALNVVGLACTIIPVQQGAPAAFYNV